MYQNKPCYLENRVVREPCKRRTACILKCLYQIYCLFLPMCVWIFGSKNASNSEHFAKITSNGHLFVQLGWLSQIGRSFEIRHFENSCSSFWCSRDNFRCMNFNKAFIGQRVPKQLANSSLYPEKKKLIRKCILLQ